jgi:hypothetical protein
MSVAAVPRPCAHEMMEMQPAASVAQAAGPGKRDGGKALQEEQVGRVNKHRAKGGSITTGGG